MMAQVPGKYGSFRFDDEGNPAQHNVLIEKGIPAKIYVGQDHSTKGWGETNRQWQEGELSP